MWIALALWLWRGGDTVATPTAPPTVKPARTIADVEAELVLSAAVVAQHRARYERNWPAREVTRHYANDKPDCVRHHEALLDEWVWWAYDDGPVVTRTGGVRQ